MSYRLLLRSRQCAGTPSARAGKPQHVQLTAQLCAIALSPLTVLGIWIVAVEATARATVCLVNACASPVRSDVHFEVVTVCCYPLFCLLA
jgi:hypothetical protein